MMKYFFNAHSTNLRIPRQTTVLPHLFTEQHPSPQRSPDHLARHFPHRDDSPSSDSTRLELIPFWISNMIVRCNYQLAIAFKNVVTNEKGVTQLVVPHSFRITSAVCASTHHQHLFSAHLYSQESDATLQILADIRKYKNRLIPANHFIPNPSKHGFPENMVVEEEPFSFASSKPSMDEALIEELYKNLFVYHYRMNGNNAISISEVINPLVNPFLTMKPISLYAEATPTSTLSSSLPTSVSSSASKSFARSTSSTTSNTLNNSQNQSGFHLFPFDIYPEAAKQFLESPDMLEKRSNFHLQSLECREECKEALARYKTPSNGVHLNDMQCDKFRFGETPTVDGGRGKVLRHCLSPVYVPMYVHDAGRILKSTSRDRSTIHFPWRCVTSSSGSVFGSVKTGVPVSLRDSLLSLASTMTLLLSCELFNAIGPVMASNLQLAPVYFCLIYNLAWRPFSFAWWVMAKTIDGARACEPLLTLQKHFQPHPHCAPGNTTSMSPQTPFSASTTYPKHSTSTALTTATSTTDHLNPSFVCSFDDAVNGDASFEALTKNVKHNDLILLRSALNSLNQGRSIDYDSFMERLDDKNLQKPISTPPRPSPISRIHRPPKVPKPKVPKSKPREPPKMVPKVPLLDFHGHYRALGFVDLVEIPADDEVQRAWTRVVKTSHPDVSSSNTTTHFLLITEAYRNLKTLQQREDYLRLCKSRLFSIK